MERDLTSDLTRQYSSLFGKRGVKKLYLFVQDVYRAGKLREIVSFAVWEIFHRLGLFPKRDYLTFSNRDAITLENKSLTGSAFDEEMGHFLGSRGLKAIRPAHNWKLLVLNADEIYGCLYPNDYDLYKSQDNGASVVFVRQFSERIKSIFISSQSTIFVCVKGSVYKSSDRGASFKKVLDLGSSESFFRFNNAMTETPDKRLWIGEYGNIWDKTGWRKLAYLYSSADDGETWETSDYLIQKGINKHIHIVRYSRLLNRLVVADGDNHKKLWLSDSPDTADFRAPKWKPVNRFHIQMGGYTSVVENDGKLIFGTDYQGGTNFVVVSTDGERFTKQVVPDPYRRSPIDNMVLRKSKSGNEIWANLPFSTGKTKCLLMYSADNCKTWHKVIEYNRTNHVVWIVSSSNEAAEELYISIENLQNQERVVYKVVDN